MNKVGVGDRVRLNSGSPECVVRAISNGVALVKWLDDSGAVQEAIWPVECVKVVHVAGTDFPMVS